MELIEYRRQVKRETDYNSTLNSIAFMKMNMQNIKIILSTYRFDERHEVLLDFIRYKFFVNAIPDYERAKISTFLRKNGIISISEITTYLLLLVLVISSIIITLLSTLINIYWHLDLEKFTAILFISFLSVLVISMMIVQSSIFNWNFSLYKLSPEDKLKSKSLGKRYKLSDIL
jgi:hypothetical protein